MKPARPDLSRWAPPGMEPGTFFTVLGLGAFVALFWSFGFLTRYYAAWRELYEWRGGEKELLPGAAMESFPVLLGDAFGGFGILALCMLALVGYHYAWHHRGSKSVYLMRRLPDPWEWHRRCWALPLLGCAAGFLSAGLLLAIYCGVYFLCTPAQCLPGNPW